MKKRVLIVHTILGLVVLFAILFQSFHAMSHLEKQFIAKHCNHKYNHKKTEINHAHHGFEHCFTCEFTFSSSLEIKTSLISLKYNSLYFKPSFLNTSESILFYTGSSFSLRGPPIV
jgi:hypothetical protein